MKRVLTIIPAAGRGARMLSLTDNCPKAMVPVAGKPLISYLLDQIIETSQKDVCVIVGYKKEVLIDYITMMYSDKLNITFIEQTEQKGLNHAIYQAVAKNVCNDFDGVFVLLSDAIFTNKKVFNFNDESFIACMPVEDYSRWCMVRIDDKRGIIGFIDKPKEKPDTNFAAAGAYYFTNTKLFKDSIAYGMRCDTINGEYQISSSLEHYMKKESLKEIIINPDQWFDFGDFTTYNKNKKLFNQCRYFNSITYTKNDSVIKTSENNKSKIQKEICWFLAIPDELKKYVAQLKSYHLDDVHPGYEMSYCNGMTLQELWLYSNLDLEQWDHILQNIYKMLLDFSNNSDPSYKVDLSKFLKDNISKRVDNYLFNDQIDYIINGRNCGNLADKYIYFEEKLNGLNNTRFSRIIHGDMVFSNILYDMSNEKITLIDPRGDFNGNIIYGDIRYDLAKLTQCILGDYDYIVNDLVKFNIDNHNVYYETYESLSSKTYNEKLDLVYKLCKLFHVNASNIIFITAIQFLTMIPLHAESKNHQDMMFIKFVELLNMAYQLDCVDCNE